MKLSPKEFVLHAAVRVEECGAIEFKEITSNRPLDTIKNTADEYVVAFLNSRIVGHIIWGIRDKDRVVVGVKLTGRERDELRRIITEKLTQIRPAISPIAFEVYLHPVYSDTPPARPVDDLNVIEICVPPVSNDDLYATGKGEVFVKTEGGKKKLSVEEIQDEVRRRHERRVSAAGSGQRGPLSIEELLILLDWLVSNALGIENVNLTHGQSWRILAHVRELEKRAQAEVARQWITLDPIVGMKLSRFVNVSIPEFIEEAACILTPAGEETRERDREPYKPQNSVKTSSAPGSPCGRRGYGPEDFQ